MALRPVINIQVDDSAWQRFTATFQQYQAALAHNPAAWARVNQQIQNTKQSFQDLVDAAVSRQGRARLVKEAEAIASRMTESVERQQRSWGAMARSTFSVAGNIRDMTRQLLRWTVVTTAITGLLGAGGLFGISRLAQSAAEQRRSSTGLGVSAGEQSAFTLNYGRVVDSADTVLNSVNSSLTNASERGNLYKAGFNEQDLRGKNAAQVSVMLVDKLKMLADKTPNELLGSIVQGYGLESLGIRSRDLQRIKDRSPAELDEYRRSFGRDTSALNIGSGSLKAWEDFKVQLERASGTIENAFIRALTPLAPELSKLSDAITDTITRLIGGEHGKNLIDAMAHGIGWLGDKLGSESFQKSITDFTDDMALLAKKVHDWVLLFNDDKEHKFRDTEVDYLKRKEREEKVRKDLEENQKGDGTLPPTWLDRLRGMFNGPTSFPGGAEGGVMWPTSFRTMGGERPFGGDQQRRPSLSDNSQRVHDYFRSHGWTEAQVSGIMANAQEESGFDPHRVNQVGGDAGLFQWRGPRAKRFQQMFGHKVHEGTLDEQLWFAQWELTEGTEQRAGNRLRGITDPGEAGDWFTRGYERPDPNRLDIIAAARAALARGWYGQGRSGGSGGGLHVRIENNTGGNAAVVISSLLA